MQKSQSLWENERMGFDDAIDLSVASLNEYGQRYRHWAIAYSGGKDSSATASFVAWAIQSGKVTAPETLTILYADTRQEFPPLQQTAMQFMDALRADGYTARSVLPVLDDRFYVYMLGRGVPPPKNRFRWCTSQLKVEPMQAALSELAWQIDPLAATQRQYARQGMLQALLSGDFKLAALSSRFLKSIESEKFLMLTGVRMGESAVRDQRIALSCSKDTGECGQGWFQTMPGDAVSDTLAPLLHWRLCFVWDWLYFGDHKYTMLGDIAVTYGDGDVRTGCIGCNLASKDTALEHLCHVPEWAHLGPLKELKPLFRELAKPRWRLRKAEPERKKDGSYAKNGQRMGPLTMDARAFALDKVLDIQRRARVDLINSEEEARIRELWSLNTWPDGWRGDEVVADVPLDAITVIGDNELVVQRRLI